MAVAVLGSSGFSNGLTFKTDKDRISHSYSNVNDIKLSHWGNWCSVNSDGAGSMDKRKFHLDILTGCHTDNLLHFNEVSFNFTLLFDPSETIMNSQMISRKVWFFEHEKKKPSCCEWYEDLPDPYTLAFVRKRSVSPLTCNGAKY